MSMDVITSDLQGQPLVILENCVLPTGDKKYNIITTRWQRVLGLHALGFEMHDSTNLVISSTCWRCGTPHKTPPLPAYLEHFGSNSALLQAGATCSVLQLVPVPLRAVLCVSGKWKWQ